MRSNSLWNDATCKYMTNKTLVNFFLNQLAMLFIREAQGDEWSRERISQKSEIKKCIFSDCCSYFLILQNIWLVSFFGSQSLVSDTQFKPTWGFYLCAAVVPSLSQNTCIDGEIVQHNSYFWFWNAILQFSKSICELMHLWTLSYLFKSLILWIAWVPLVSKRAEGA